MCNRHAIRAKVNKASKQAKRRSECLPCERLVQGKRHVALYTCNYPFYSAYNSLNHRVNFGQFKLCTDTCIEKNPGPSVYVDATKTINAPYCQGNVTVFGENAGQQCVAMSLCALIYNKITKITSVDDMTQIMIVGIQLYFSLSLLARQSMLMISELPGMVTVFEKFFHLEYSDSYTCNIHHYCICHSQGTAFETLLALNYNSFILTVAIIGVCNYSIETGRYNVFDSHARDMYHNSHSEGTCVLL
ncbi:unnamed protein product, partial [Porites evermanni]